MPYYTAAPAELLAPARRAAVLMFVLGGLILLLGVCGVASLLVPQSPEDTRRAQEMISSLGLPTTSLSPEAMRTAGVVEVVLIVGVGVVLVALGIAVRRGSRGAMIGSIVLSALLLGGSVLTALATGVMAIAAPPIAACACGSLLPAALLVVLVVWLVQGLRAGGRWKLAQAQYLAQYWQYQQVQAQAQAAGAAYGYGYGYGAAPEKPPEQQQQQQQPSQPPPPNAG
jgi:hypothetical protein